MKTIARHATREPQQLLPRLLALAVAVLDGDRLLLTVGRRAHHHQDALAVLLEPDGEVDAVDPDVDVLLVRQVAPAPPLALGFQDLLEPHHGRRGEAGSVLTEQRREGFREAAGRGQALPLRGLGSEPCELIARKTARAVLGALAVLALWEGLAFSSSESGLVPHLPSVLRAFVALFQDDGIARDSAWTLRRMLVGFGLAVSLGIPAGILLGAVPWLGGLFGGWVSFFRSIPAFVVLPIMLAVLKGGEAARTGMITFGCFFVLVAYASMGTQNVRRLRIEVAQAYRLPRTYVFFRVILLDALPQILDGVRVSLSLALILALVSEIMLGASYGLGTRVNDSLAGFDLPRMYALVLFVGCLGWVLNSVASLISTRLAPYGSQR